MNYSEQAIVGSLLRGEGWESITVTAAEFTDESLKRLFVVIAKNAEAGKPYDLVTICETFGYSLAEMANFVAKTPHSVSLEHCCGTMKLKARKQAIAKAANQLIELCSSSETDADELGAAIDNIMDGTTTATSRTQHVTAAIQSAFDAIEARTRGPEGVQTGIACLDRRMTSMRAGNLIIIAARPAVGKTGLALNIAMHVAQHYGPVFMASAEMTAAELGERVLSARSGVSYGAFRSGNLESRDYDAMLPAIAALKKLPFYIDDTGCPTVASVCAEAHRLHRSKPLSLVVVDYLTLLQGEGANRAQEVGYVSRRLKKLAKSLKCPVIALAQLNRNGAKAGVKPTLADLRDSGEIEQDADAVMFLHRENEGDATIEAIFGKGRGFPIGSEWLRWDGDHMRFVEGEEPVGNAQQYEYSGRQRGFASPYAARK